MSPAQQQFYFQFFGIRRTVVEDVENIETVLVTDIARGRIPFGAIAPSQMQDNPARLFAV
jgi:hypothetical protein